MESLTNRELRLPFFCLLKPVVTVALRLCLRVAASETSSTSSVAPDFGELVLFVLLIYLQHKGVIPSLLFCALSETSNKDSVAGMAD